MSTTSRHTVHRVCPLCEATCGLTMTVETVPESGSRLVDIRGDEDDPFSRGYICPKAYGLRALYEDPDRLRAPVRRSKSGWEEISWDDAFAETLDRLNAIRSESGADSVGLYLGNPSAHSLHSMVYGPLLYRALGSKSRFSASSADQLPKMISSALMFGKGLTIPIPDIDRTRYWLVLGANPLVSNGSLMTAPDLRGRIRAILERGGKVVVLDPRRTETARKASEHHFIRPGSDALFLLAMVRTMFAEDLVDLGRAGDWLESPDQVARVQTLVAPFTAERVAAACGIDAGVIVRLTREFCAAEGAACYGRIGTTCQEFGTLASWAVELVNILSGNLDRPGGVMFPRPAANRGSAGGRRKKPWRMGRWKSRVAGLPEAFGELPVSTMADEMLEDGDSRIRAMITVAGNPVLSAPNSGKLDRAFAGLDFMVAVDIYRNETTRHADIILPPPSPIERDNYDLAFYQLSIRNIAKYSPPAIAKDPQAPDEWEILLTLAKGLMGQKDAPLAMADEFFISQLTRMELGDGTAWDGLEAAEVLAALKPRRGPARVIDLLLRLGPYGDHFGRRPDGITLARLEDEPHGIDLGALEPRLPEVLATVDQRIDLAPEALVSDIERLERSLDRPAPDYLLIGRRQLRSNNSWMHNLTPLVKGKDRCTLLIHPSDARRLGMEDGDPARISSRVGAVTARIHISEEMMPGVVSLPHGWGHDSDGIRMSVAASHAGVNVNLVSDDRFLDRLSGNAAFNGLPVTVESARES